jgi:hypothetical protein
MTTPAVVQAALGRIADACARRNHHRWQEFFLTTRTLVHSGHGHTAITVLTSCLNHAH